MRKRCILGVVASLLFLSCSSTQLDVEEYETSSLGLESNFSKLEQDLKHRENGVFRKEEVLLCLKDPTLCEGEGIHTNGDEKRIRISDTIQECLNNSQSCNGTFDVVVSFDDTPERVPYESYMVTMKDGIRYLNGKAMSEEDEASLEKQYVERRAQTLANIKAKRNAIIQEIYDLGIDLDKDAADQYIGGYESLHVNLSINDIQKVIAHKSFMGIREYIAPIDTSLASAMLATYVTQGSSFTYNHNGQNIGIYMSEMGCPPTGYMSNYTPIFGSDTNHSRNVSAIIREVSPNSYTYCYAGCTLPPSSIIGAGANGTNPDIYYANYSCRHFANDPEGTYNGISREFDNFVYQTGVTVINAAGNIDVNNNYDEHVSPSAIGMNVLTVGNYYDYNNTPASFSINSTSCYDDADIHNSKPELSAPGTYIDAGTDTNGMSITMSGTSQATPHVTGMLANVGSRWSTPTYNALTPDHMRMYALHGARDSVQGGYDKVGVGGADFEGMYKVHIHGWITGDYATNAANDGGTNTNMIEETFTTSSNTQNVRVVVTWLNQGTYIYNNSNTTLPGGVAYAVLVYDPNNNLLEAELDRYNNFVVLDVDTLTPGTYKIMISRVWNYDTTLDLRMSWGVSSLTSCL